MRRHELPLEERVIDVLLLHGLAVYEHSDSVAIGAVVQHFHFLSLIRTHLAVGGASLLFAEIEADMNEEELAITKTTPNYQLLPQ